MFFLATRENEYKIQASFELKRYQRTETVSLESLKVWLTDVFTVRFLNDFIKNSIKKEILKRVIINGSTCSSWLFQRLSKLKLIVTDKSSLRTALSSWFFLA